MRRTHFAPALRPRAALVVLLLSLPVLAQSAVPQVPAVPALPVPALNLVEFAAAWPPLNIAAEELGGKVVKGAPYSADAVSQTVQTLPDGNRIVRTQTMRLARDGEGRTRQERLVDGKPGTVFINDVIAGKRWMLLQESRRAVELPGRGAGALHMSGDAEEMRSWAEAMREWAREFGARMRGEPMSGPQAGSMDIRVARESAEGRRDVVVVRDVVVSSSASGAAPAPAVPAVPPVPPVPLVPAPAFAPAPSLLLPPPGDGVTTSLGSRDIDGLRADGTRTTWTIPAGRIGNEKPIAITSERWYSPELMLVVETRRNDPRSGETSYRLTHLKRGEPDAALFRLPADYEVGKRTARERK